MADAKIVLTAEDKTRAAFESAKGGLAQVSSMAAAAGFSLASLGSAATLAGLVNMVKSAANGMDAMNDLKDATGASIENISALESVALRTGGNLDTVSTSLIKFNMALGQTIKPGSEAEKVIKAIGLNAKELRDMDPAEALRLTAVALNQFADDGNKARAVQELFGKSLREIAPYLKDVAEAGELVATRTKEQTDAAEKFNKELFKMSAGLTEVSRDLAGPVIGGMNSLIDRFRQGKVDGDNFLTTMLKIGMVNLNPAEQLVAFAKNFLPGGGSGAKPEGSWGDPVVTPPPSLKLPQEAKVKAVAKATKELTDAEKDRAYHAAYMHKQTLAAYDAERKALEDIAKANIAMQEMREQGDRDALVDIERRISDLDREARQYGMLESQIVAVTRAQLEQAREGMYLAGEDIEAVNQRIDAYRRLEERLQGRELREANERGAATAATAWSTVGDAFVDNLMRGGKSVAQYLKDLFRTLVLRPILQPIGNMMGSAVNSLTGMGSTGAAQGGLGSLGSLGSLFSSGAGTTVSNGLISGFGMNMTNIGNAFAGGEFALGAGSAMPYIGLALAAISLLKNAFKGETRVGGQYSDTSFLQGPSGGEINGEATRTAIGTTIASINQTLAALGSGATLINLQSGLEQSEKGKGFAYAGGQLSTGAVFGQGVGGLGWQNRRGSMTAEQAAVAFGEELKQATLQALQAADVPGQLGDYLRQLGDIDALSGGALDAALGRINKALTEKEQLEATLFELTATDLEKLNKVRAAERAAIDSSNLALLEQVYAQQDLLRSAEAVSEVMAVDIPASILAMSDAGRSLTETAIAAAQASSAFRMQLGATVAGAMEKREIDRQALLKELVGFTGADTDAARYMASSPTGLAGFSADLVQIQTDPGAIHNLEKRVLAERELVKARDDYAATMSQYTDSLNIQTGKFGAFIDNIKNYIDQLEGKALSGRTALNQYVAARDALRNAGPGDVTAAASRFLEASRATSATRLDYLRDVAMVREALASSIGGARNSISGLTSQYAAMMQGSESALALRQAQEQAQLYPVGGFDSPRAPVEPSSSSASDSGSAAIVAELQRLNARMEKMEKSSTDTTNILRRVTRDGTSLRTETA